MVQVARSVDHDGSDSSGPETKKKTTTPNAKKSKDADYVDDSGSERGSDSDHADGGSGSEEGKSLPARDAKAKVKYDDGSETGEEGVEDQKITVYRKVARGKKNGKADSDGDDLDDEDAKDKKEAPKAKAAAKPKKAPAKKPAPRGSSKVEYKETDEEESDPDYGGSNKDSDSDFDIKKARSGAGSSPSKKPSGKRKSNASPRGSKSKKSYRDDESNSQSEDEEDGDETYGSRKKAKKSLNKGKPSNKFKAAATSGRAAPRRAAATSRKSFKEDSYDSED